MKDFVESESQPTSDWCEFGIRGEHSSSHRWLCERVFSGIGSGVYKDDCVEDGIDQNKILFARFPHADRCISSSFLHSSFSGMEDMPLIIDGSQLMVLKSLFNKLTTLTGDQ